MNKRSRWSIFFGALDALLFLRLWSWWFPQPAGMPGILALSLAISAYGLLTGRRWAYVVTFIQFPFRLIWFQFSFGFILLLTEYAPFDMAFLLLAVGLEFCRILVSIRLFGDKPERITQQQVVPIQRKGNEGDVIHPEDGQRPVPNWVTWYTGLSWWAINLSLITAMVAQVYTSMILTRHVVHCEEAGAAGMIAIMLAVAWIPVAAICIFVGSLLMVVGWLKHPGPWLCALLLMSWPIIAMAVLSMHMASLPKVDSGQMPLSLAREVLTNLPLAGIILAMVVLVVHCVSLGYESHTSSRRMSLSEFSTVYRASSCLRCDFENPRGANDDEQGK